MVKFHFLKISDNQYKMHKDKYHPQTVKIQHPTSKPLTEDRMRQIVHEAKKATNLDSTQLQKRQNNKIILSHQSLNRVNTFNYRLRQVSENMLIKTQQQLNHFQIKNIEAIVLGMENRIQNILKNQI